MNEWLTGFRARFEEALHDLLWRQWTLLGVPGTVTPHPSGSPLDPEALLLLTLESARTEPRLFDEVLDWLVEHGHWIDVQRLRNLMKGDFGTPLRLVAAAAAVAGEHDASAKWQRLATPPARGSHKWEPLFLLPGSKSLASPAVFNSTFIRYGYRRPPVKNRGLTGPIPKRLAAALRFRLRALFGIGIRAEVLTFLIAGKSGLVKQIARSCGYSTLGTLQAVRELAESDSVQILAKGRERIYWTDAIHWWEFLGIERHATPGRIVSTPEGLAYEDADVRTLRDAEGRAVGWSQGPLVTWVDWKSFFAGLAQVLRFLRRTDLPDATPYAVESELGQVLEKAAPLLTSAGVPFRLPKGSAAPRDVAERLLQAIS